MGIGRDIRRRTRAAVLPLVFLSLVGYFLWQASQGERGSLAYRLRQADLLAAQAEFGRAESDLAIWERRVVALRTDRLDPDALDERSRAMLNLSDPGEIIVPYAQGSRLF